MACSHSHSLLLSSGPHQVLFCNTSVQTLLAGQIGLGGEMPAYMIAEGRHAPLYFAEGRLYLRKVDGECFFMHPRPCLLRDVLGTDDELFIDFISKMLTLDMHARVSAAEALMHPWFTRSTLPRPVQLAIADDL